MCKSTPTTRETKQTTNIRNKKNLVFFNWQGNILQDNGWSSHNNQQRYNVESPTVCRAVKHLPWPLPCPSVTGNNGGLVIADTLALFWQTEHTSSPPCKAWGVWGWGCLGKSLKGYKKTKKERKHKASFSSKSSSITVWTFWSLVLWRHSFREREWPLREATAAQRQSRKHNLLPSLSVTEHQGWGYCYIKYTSVN